MKRFCLIFAALIILSACDKDSANQQECVLTSDGQMCRTSEGIQK